MAFAEEVGAYRFRLLGPRVRVAKDRRYRLPRPDGSPATVLESPQLVLATNNVDLGPVEAELKAPLRELTTISGGCALACGAIVNAAVRDMPDDLAFVSIGVGNGFMFLAGMLDNDQKACVGVDQLAGPAGQRDALRTRFDARRAPRHAFFEGNPRDYFGDGGSPGIGVLLYDGEHSYERQLDALRAAESSLADDCLIIVNDANRPARRQAAVDFAYDSGLSWRVALDERTAGRHPTLSNGLMVLEAGGDGRESQIELATETGLVDPIEIGRHTPAHPPRVTVLHYRNPWVGAQDYPNLEVVGLNPGKSLTEAFAGSTGQYVVVLDPDVALTPDALSEAVREAECRPPHPAASRIWRSRRGPSRKGMSRRLHRPVEQAEYFPSWPRTLDDAQDPQTVTVARALSIIRDNLVAFDLDPQADDLGREIAVRFARGLRLEGAPARCSRVPDGVVVGRVGAVLTPDRRWLIESVGAVARAWPELTLDNRGRVELAEPPRESDERVATVACELRRAWTENYGHWTLDVLTRVAILLRAGVPDDVKLLVPEPVLPFHRETLVGLGIADHRIIAWDGRPTRFRSVYVPTARPPTAFVFPAGVEVLRELGAIAGKAGAKRRLFVSRRQLGRRNRIANEEELLEVAAGLGFVEVMPETLPYAEQVRLFSEAEAVTGAHGSGLVNAVFMARGTGLCELAPARLHAEKLPNLWNLAACGRQRYGLCVAGGKRVDPKRFKRVLHEVTRSVKRGRTSAKPATAAQNA